jgi:hypothetical protein
VSSTLSHPAKPRAKSLSELIGPALDPLVRKRGLARAELIARWPDIIGEAYARGTAPERIRWPRDGKAATLVIRCDPSLALQLAHETDRVRERLNGYLGFPAVGAIRIVSQRVGSAPVRPRPSAPKRELSPALRAKIAGCDSTLRASLDALGRAVIAGS